MEDRNCGANRGKKFRRSQPLGARSVIEATVLPLVLTSMLLSGPIAIALLAGGSPSAFAQGTFDISAVPRAEGAEVAGDRPSSSSVTYVYPASRSNAALATDKALTSQGWLPYRTPDQPRSDRYKKGRTGIYVSFSMSDGKADRSRISYSHNNSIPANVPFPEDATNIVYDENRPFLKCSTGLGIEAALDFFTKGLASEGWSPLDTAAIASRWPDAKLGNTIENGSRVYFSRGARERQWPPVMLTLQRDATGNTNVDLRTARFALPKDLTFYQDFAGLPASQHYKRSGGTGSADSVRREATALVIAEVPAVLAFYRRELTSRGYQEQAAGAAIGEAAVKVTFTKPDDTAVLELRQLYDLTDVRLVAQLSPTAIAERARAKREADATWIRDARKQAEALMAASEAKRLAAATAVANAPVEALRPLASAGTPIPLPENATAVKFDGDAGKLEFSSPSTPKSIAQFYRGQLKSGGWKEVRSPIDNPSMVRLDFVKGAQKIGFTVMLFGGDARTSATGTGLQVPADPNRETEQLEAEEVAGFPVPKKRTMSAPGAWNMKGNAIAFRRDYNAHVPSDIGSVLAFYRRELPKRQWKERTEGASIRPDSVAIGFTSPEGPATLRLGRRGKETTVSLVVKNPAEAAKAGLLPAAGRAKVVLGNIGDEVASLTINQKSFKVAPGTGSSPTPDGPMLDLKPGKYKYVLKLAGKPSQAGEIVVGADDAWGLMVGPGGVLALQMY